MSKSQTAQVRCARIGREPDQQINTDNGTNYYEMPKYVVDVLGGAVSKTYRRLPQSRNHRNPLRNIFIFLFEPYLDLYTPASSGFAFEETTVFRGDNASEGISIFRSEMLPLVARRRRELFKLMLSSVCCKEFFTLWNLANSVLEVSF